LGAARAFPEPWIRRQGCSHLGVCLQGNVAKLLDSEAACELIVELGKNYGANLGRRTKTSN